MPSTTDQPPGARVPLLVQRLSYELTRFSHLFARHHALHPTDVEALAPAGRGQVWVGDIGDNRSARSQVQVARIPVGRGDRDVSPTVYDLVYPDGAHDAETLVSDPRTGRLRSEEHTSELQSH